MFKEDVLKNLNITITDKQMKQFDEYFKYLIEYNQHTNLTRITQEDEVYYKHFYDSLSISRLIDFTKVDSICDMGSGAGFPSIPLKIVFPNLKVYIVDSLNKRINFLQNLIGILKLKDVNTFHNRAEVFALKNQEKFDVVTARALGALDLIAEMGIPMVKVGGYFIAMKGSRMDEEIDESEIIFKQLKVKVNKIDEFELPNGYGFRANILIQKKNHVQGFPRDYSKMTKDK